MISNENLAKNTLYLTLASVGQKAIAFIYFTMIARFMGAENTGAYFTSLALIVTFTVVADMGITSVVIREVAKNVSEAKLWCRTMVGMKIIFVPIAILMAIFAPYVFGYSEDVKNLVLIAVTVLALDAFSLGFYGLLRGLRNLKFESAGVFIGQSVIATIGIIFMITDVATLQLLIIALIAGSFWNVLFSGYQIVKRLGFGALVPTYKQGKTPLKIAFVFFLAGIFMQIITYSDSLIMSRVLGNEMVGFYAVANKLTNAFRFLPLAFVAALFPTMSAVANDKEQLKKTLLQSSWYMALIGMPIVFGIWSLAPEIVLAFYEEEYISSIFPLQILVFVLIPLFLEFPFGSMLNATNRQNTKTTILGIGMVLSVVLNLILITQVGLYGASIAALSSFSLIFFLSAYYGGKVVSLKPQEFFREIGGLFMSACLMALVVVLMKPYIHLVLVIPLGAVVYLASGFALKAITFDHIKSVTRLLKKKTSYVAEDITTNS